MKITVDGLGNPEAEAALAEALTQLAKQATIRSPAPSLRASHGAGGAVNINCEGQPHSIDVENMRQKLLKEGCDLSTDQVRRAIEKRAGYDKVARNKLGGLDAEDFIFRDICRRGP